MSKCLCCTLPQERKAVFYLGRILPLYFREIYGKFFTYKYFQVSTLSFK